MSDVHDPIARMPVTAVIARRPAPGRQAELLAWAEEFVAAARSFEGHAETRVFAPTPRSQKLRTDPARAAQSTSL